MEHVNYSEDGIIYNYYRINVNELSKRVHIGGKYFTIYSPRNTEKRKLKSFENGKPCKKSYVQLHCGFDIETTTVYNGYDDLHKREIHNSFMYMWQFGFQSNGIQFVCKGRTWEEFEQLCNILVSKLSKKQKILIWVHNLPYEFSFKKKRYNQYISNMFCKEHDKPIKYDFMEKLEFRDSLQLHRKGLEGLAKDFCTSRKLKGDLDFTIKRNNLTPLTEKEERYCDNDVIVLSEFDCYVWDNLIIGDSIPITQTGILRSEIIQGLKDRGRYKHIVQYVHDNFPSQKLYNLMMNYLFKGGFCGANFQVVGYDLYNLDSYDFTSSYPSIMLQPRYRFPKGKFTANDEIKTLEQFKELSKNKCCFALFRFHNIRATTPHNFISEHKIYNKECKHIVVLNGKVRRVVGGYIEVFENEVDIESYEKFYKWCKVEIVKCWESDTMYSLPKYITKSLLKAYELKSTLKKEGKPYATEKVMVNSGYGMLVQRLIENEILWDSESGTFDIESIVDYEKMIKNKVFLPTWGIYITSFARRNLLSGIYEYKDTTYCYDTDSIKGHFEDLTYIKEYNRLCEEQNKIIADTYGIDFEIVKDLGCWDCETENEKYKRFKTLGSKRYIYTTNDTDIHQTVCGLGDKALYKHSKKMLEREHVETTDENIINKCFSEFADGMDIQDANKLLHTLQEECTVIIDGVEMHEYSGTVLTPNKFKLSLKQVYVNYISQFHSGMAKYEKRIL